MQMVELEARTPQEPLWGQHATEAEKRHLDLNLNISGGPGSLCARGVIPEFY